jgi:MFS transporter, SP family, general alpha glucoside:H+ symporter
MAESKDPSIALDHIDSTSSTLNRTTTAGSEQPIVADNVSQGAPKEMRLLKSVRLYPKITRYTFFLMSAVLLYGYDLVIVGTLPAVPGFQKDFGRLHDDKYIIPAHWISLWSALGPAGALAGAIAAGWIQDKIGRKMCLAIGSGLSGVAVAIVSIVRR